MGLASLNSNKLRSSLTILGITIGVFSVVGVMTALSAIRSSIDKNLGVFAGGVFQVSKMPAIRINNGWWNYRDRPRIDYRQARRFKIMMESESDALVCNYLSDGGEIARYKDRKTGGNVNVIVTNENYMECFPLDVEFGHNLTNEDVEFNRTVTVIGSNIAWFSFRWKIPSGSKLCKKARNTRWWVY